MLDMKIVDAILYNAFNEDMPMGDITTDCIFNGSEKSEAKIICREKAVLAGIDVFKRVFELLDADFEFVKFYRDGDMVPANSILAEFSGSTSALLKGERTALNLLQRMSGVATKTHEFCDLVKDLKVRVADTRKTTPGIRYLEKYAVKAGGGTNHRFCLSDGVLIKDNHIKAAGGITTAVKKARAGVPHTLKIEVETETIDMVKEALECGADIIMLDNMSPALMTEAVKLIGGRALTEASGTVRLENIREIALTGVDIISIGRITHSVNSIDISMKFV